MRVKKMWRADTIDGAENWRETGRKFVKAFAGPDEAENVKDLIRQAARNSGRPFTRLWNIYYGKGKPSDAEIESLKRDLERRQIERAWADIRMDEKLAAMTAEHERLKRDVRDLGRAIASVRRSIGDAVRDPADEAGSVAYGRRAEDR